MIQKRILRLDTFNELDFIEFMNKKRRFSSNELLITIQPTLDCNFRCTYCYEEHKKEVMTEQVMNNLIQYLENNIEKHKKLTVGWFGGEPLLESDIIFNLTETFKEICDKNNIEYNSYMTTNGYLFNEDITNRIDELSLKSIQITIDGNKKYHDRKRPLANGDGTYDKIIYNIKRIMEKNTNININLRINIDNENYQEIDDLLDEIPIIYRNRVNAYVHNLFDSYEPINTYKLSKNIIDKGFKYVDIHNKFSHCEVCISSSFLIEPNGKIAPCSVAAESGIYYGSLNNEGKIRFDNNNVIYSLKNTSVFKSPKCCDCIQLPMCMGGCLINRYNNSNSCINKFTGLSLKDRINLHYYYDKKIIS